MIDHPNYSLMHIQKCSLEWWLPIESLGMKNIVVDS